MWRSSNGPAANTAEIDPPAKAPAPPPVTPKKQRAPPPGRWYDTHFFFLLLHSPTAHHGTAYVSR